MYFLRWKFQMLGHANPMIFSSNNGRIEHFALQFDSFKPWKWHKDGPCLNVSDIKVITPIVNTTLIDIKSDDPLVSK